MKTELFLTKEENMGARHTCSLDNQRGKSIYSPRQAEVMQRSEDLRDKDLLNVW